MVVSKSAVKRQILGGAKENSFSIEMPSFVEMQVVSYERFLQTKRLKAGEPLERVGLESVFREIFPIESSKGTLILDYDSYQLEFDKMSFSEEECIQKGLTYAASLKIKINLYIQETGELREKEMYLGDIPLMTPRGTFIINGAERVVVSQIHRSPGIIFEQKDTSREKEQLTARLIPFHGSWLEFEIDSKKKSYLGKD